MEDKEEEEVWEELPEGVKKSAVRWWLGTKQGISKFLGVPEEDIKPPTRDYIKYIKRLHNKKLEEI